MAPAPPKPVLDTLGNPTGAAFNWLTGRDGVQTEPGLPTLPKQIDDVTSSTGEVLRGVGFVSGTYTDTTGVTPLTGAPTTEQNGIHTSFVSPVFFPQRLATVNYFGALDGNERSGALCCYVFLSLNGLELECTNEALVDLVLAVAEGSRDKPEVAAFLRRHARG